MNQNISIEVEEKTYQKLKELCKGDESSIQKYILQALNEKINQSDFNPSNDSLEEYLNKGKSGSRNYGVKGQGW